MFWPFRKKEPARLSEIVEGAISALLNETRTRFITVYWSMLGDELGELFAANYKSFVIELTRNFLLGQVATGRFAGVKLSADQMDKAWRKGLEEALQRQSRTGEACQKALEDYQLAVSEYEQAIVDAAAEGFPASIGFLITSRFADRIADLAALERRKVMLISASITDMVVAACKRAPKLWRLTGP